MPQHFKTPEAARAEAARILNRRQERQPLPLPGMLTWGPWCGLALALLVRWVTG